MHNLIVILAPWLLVLIEFLLLMCATGLILFSSRKPSALDQPAAFHSLQRAFARIARHQGLSVLLVGLSVVASRVTLIPILGIPQPGAHDEFSYLLAADTFAHGKLTNPTHPMWIHFESFHIIERPTYMSMYPPAQGLVLAAGQFLGHPWVGNLLVTALLCSALCWLLQGWLPPPWALFGAALAALRIGILSYWMNSYWGGSVAALGGVLVLGAWPRLRKHLRVRDALLMALGVAILANTRPYEGFVFAIPVAFAMLFWLTGKNRPEFRQSVSRVILPILLALFVAAIATAHYNQHVTGNPLRMPYQVNRDNYSAAPYFIWQTPRPEPVYHHDVMRDFYQRELQDFQNNETLVGFLKRGIGKLISLWRFYLGPLLTLPLLALPFVIADRKMHLPLLICAAMLAAFAVQTWTLPHYFAPATGALYLIIVQCLRHLRQWTPAGRPIGTALVRMVPLLACVMILLRVTSAAIHVQIEPPWPRGILQRANILRQLEQLPGQQLVIVRYGNHHNLDAEWVYNNADIDQAKIVWARDMGAERNHELLQYFRDRKIWLVEGDSPEPQAHPYIN